MIAFDAIPLAAGLAMRRKHKNVFKELSACPWWVGLVVGGIGYLLLAHVLPPRLQFHPYLAGMAHALPAIAPLWLTACAGTSLIALLVRGLRRCLYERVASATQVADLSWQQFEHFVGEHFRRQGFTVREVGSTSGDDGIDLLLIRDGMRHVVQCKHWKARKVGVQVVRELVGTVHLSGVESGYLVISGRATAAAARAAREGNIGIVTAADVLRTKQHQAKRTRLPNDSPTERSATPCASEPD